ncbi:MAG: phosphodiester glycosidase family protein [Bacteroidales bacterium]|nr:phosphodiester glycosidase family protein [Bacteroidales bacterium]
MNIKSRINVLSCILLLGFISCSRDAMEDSHFIYFSPTEPYERIGVVECEINQITGEIRNIEPIPGNVDMMAMPIYFVTNHDHNGVYVNGVLQESGVTLNDFTSPVIYEVHSSAGIAKYTVTLEQEVVCQTQTAVKLMHQTDILETVNAEEETWITDEVRQSVVDFTTDDGRKLRLCMIEADMREGSMTLRPLLPDNKNEWGLQNIVDQASALEVEGDDVICAINGDTFDAFTGKPDGLVLKHREMLNPMDSRCFFGIREDGRLSLGDTEDFFVVEGKLTDATGASGIVIENSGLVAGLDSDQALKSRSFAGMDSFDLKKLYFVVIQSLDADESGVTLEEAIDILLPMGIGHAVSLSDGEYASLVSFTDGQLQPVNKSKLEPVANGIALIRKK